ncbi:MAG: CDP-alcohol phosphatidyltransferase family protein [Halobacteriales archaeon]
MKPRLLDLLEPPDFVSLMNAGFGFIALIAVAYDDFAVAAGMVLVGAIADGLDGIIARRTSSGELGVDIDSLSDIVSFGIAPAFLAHYVARETSLLLSLVPIVYVLAALVRLAGYNVRDVDSRGFTGVPSTFAGVFVVVLFLSGLPELIGAEGLVLVTATVILAYMMLVEISYPEIRDRHAVVAGAVVALTVVFPIAYDAVLAKLLLVALLGYIVLAPRYYAGPKK